MAEESGNINVDITQNAVPTAENNSGIIDNLMKKISDNKIYIYIGVAVVVLGVVLYYFYIKNKKETMTNTNKNEEPLPQLSNPNIENNMGLPINVNPGDHFVIDPNGRPVKVTPNVPGALMMNNPEMMIKRQQQIMQQQNMQPPMNIEILKQQIEQQNQPRQVTKPRPKLRHPSNDSDVEQVRIPQPDNDDSDQAINMEIARIQSNEDDNVAEHNLTHSELAEINKKVEMMNSNN